MECMLEAKMSTHRSILSTHLNHATHKRSSQLLTGALGVLAAPMQWTDAAVPRSSQVHTLSAHGTDAAAVHTGATCSQVYSEYSQQRCGVPTSESPITMLIFHPLQCEHAPCYDGAVRAALMYDGTVPKSTP
jgi:hypothetical protein